MYVILVYDVDETRVSSVNKLLKKYLLWVQNSVFEGDISQSLLESLLRKLDSIITGNDSLIVYKFKSESQVEKELRGKHFDMNVI
ncbi:MAG: CRISPR-associated endonuclease Cas2 [Thermoplasmatales archaeon]